MSLGAIFERFAQAMPDGVVVRVGSDETVARSDAPPRVVIDPVGEVIESPHGQGAGVGRPHWLCSRAVDVQFHLWGEDIDRTEDLLELVLNVLQEQNPGDGHRRRQGRWIGRSTSDRGVVYVLSVTFLLPVARRETVLRLNQLPITGEFVQPEPA